PAAHLEADRAGPCRHRASVPPRRHAARRIRRSDAQACVPRLAVRNAHAADTKGLTRSRSLQGTPLPPWGKVLIEELADCSDKSTHGLRDDSLDHPPQAREWPSSP